MLSSVVVKVQGERVVVIAPRKEEVDRLLQLLSQLGVEVAERADAPHCG